MSKTTKGPGAPGMAQAQTVEQQLAPLLALLQNANSETVTAIRNSLNASGVVEQAKPKGSNESARRIAYSAGEIIHPDGFAPLPSDALVDMMGMEAAKATVAER